MSPNKLTDTQLVLLSAAAQRDDGAIDPAEGPKGGLAKKAISKLLTDGLLEEVPAGGMLPVWRRNNDQAAGAAHHAARPCRHRGRKANRGARRRSRLETGSLLTGCSEIWSDHLFSIQFTKKSLFPRINRPKERHVRIGLGPQPASQSLTHTELGRALGHFRRSVGEVLITRRTSEVAVCCSSASESSRVRAVTWAAADAIAATLRSPPAAPPSLLSTAMAALCVKAIWMTRAHRARRGAWRPR